MFDGTYVRLPNSDVFLSEIRNFSSAAARRVEMTVRVAYKEDVAKVIGIIQKGLKENPLVLVEPAPDIYVESLGESAVNINVWCWAPYSVWFDILKQVAEQMKRELDASKIEMPFPQRVVYIEERSGHRPKGRSSVPVGEVGGRLEEHAPDND
jgi:small-conductance mechanosensitive channel